MSFMKTHREKSYGVKSGDLGSQFIRKLSKGLVCPTQCSGPDSDSIKFHSDSEEVLHPARTDNNLNLIQ